MTSKRHDLILVDKTEMSNNVGKKMLILAKNGKNRRKTAQIRSKKPTLA